MIHWIVNGVPEAQTKYLNWVEFVGIEFLLDLHSIDDSILNDIVRFRTIFRSMSGFIWSILAKKLIAVIVPLFSQIIWCVRQKAV